MKYLKTLVFLLFFSNTFAQNQLKIDSLEKEIGKNLSLKTTIKGIEYAFPKEVYKVSGVGDYLTVQLRPYKGTSYKRKGLLVGLNIGEGSVAWKRKIKYEAFMTQFDVERVWQYDSTLLFVHKDENQCLDIATGQIKWELGNYDILKFFQSNQALFFRRSSSQKDTNNLIIVNTKNGTIKWQKTYQTKDVISSMCILNDTSLLVSSNGLNTFNMQSGNGWKYNTVAGKKTHVFVYPLGVGIHSHSRYHIFSEMISNPMIEDSCVFIAGKETIAKVSLLTGEHIWETPLPKNITSKSHIFSHQNLVIMVNYGFASYEGTYKRYGTPYIAAFDKVTGKQLYLIKLQHTSSNVLGIDYSKGFLTVVFAKSVRQFDFVNGKERNQIDNRKADISSFRGFPSSQVYIKSGDLSLVNLWESDSSKMYVLTSNAQCLVLDQNLNINSRIEEAQLYTQYMEYNGFKFLGSNTQTIVVDSNNLVVARIGLSVKAKLIGHYLYEFRLNKLMRVDVANCIGE
jgi:outer membrane protein assembly factor BamB